MFNLILNSIESDSLYEKPKSIKKKKSKKRNLKKKKSKKPIVYTKVRTYKKQNGTKVKTHFRKKVR